MKLKTKSILSLLIALAMCMSLCSMSAFAANTAKIGETEYATLADAIAAVPDGTATEIDIISDIQISGNAGVSIPVNKIITLDLNGHTVSNYVNENKASQVIANNGTLTIKDSATGGTITNICDPDSIAGEWWSTPQYNYATNVIANGGTLTVESGNLTQTASGSICYAIDNNSTSRNTILNINGGTLTSAGTVIRMFCNSVSNDNTLNMTDGTVETNGAAALWIQLPNEDASKSPKATLNISGGTLSGSSYAFYDYSYGNSFDNTQYNISGGNFEGTYVFSYGANIDIQGGNFDSYVYVKQDKASNISISGGNFTYVSAYGNNPSSKFITGGKYIYEPDAEFIADGYYAKPLTADDAPYNFIVVPIPPIEISDSDAYILNDAGNLRFITNINDVSGTVSSYGSWVVDENYLNGGSIETKHAVLEKAESIGADDTFVTDIMNIPQTMLGTTFYAKSFITVGGAPVWSEVYSTTVNDSDHNK